jgi:hypothetical protein
VQDRREKIIAKGTRCEALLRDEDLQQAFQDVRDYITKTWYESEMDDDEGHKLLKQALWATSMVEKMLEQAISDGKLESFNLEQEQTTVTFLGDLRGRLGRKSN